MEKNNTKPKINVKKRVIVGIVIAVLIIVATIAVIFFLRKEEDKKDGLGYDDAAVTVTDEDELQELVDGMVEKTEDGKMSLEYKNVATSKDGKTFSCYIANSIKNKYDMYLSIYSDETLQEELYLTKLIKPGDGIENFELSKSLENGTHQCLLVLTQVEEDHKTIHSQIKVVYNLSVQK